MQCRQRDIEIEIRIFYGIKPFKKETSHTDLQVLYLAEIHLSREVFN